MRLENENLLVSGKMIWKLCVFITLVLMQLSDGRRLQREKSRNVLCHRSHKFNNEEICNTKTNCKYGGLCRKVANFKTDKATLRLIVPSNTGTPDFHNPNPRRGRRRSSSIYPLLPHIDQSPGNECVCSFSCSRRFFHTERQLMVCGSNGKTYPTECHLKREACRCQANITIETHGSCKIDSTNVVIGVDANGGNEAGTTGTCAVQCKFGSKCDDAGKCSCNVECFAQSPSYVCGEDGRTYTNECHIKQAECRHQKQIKILHTGTCSAEEKLRRESQEFSKEENISNPCESSDCDAAASDPLCGNDGISYPNDCVMKHAACIKEKPIRIEHMGYCRQQFEMSEPPILLPANSRVAAVPDQNDPCIGILCNNDAVCIKHDEYDFICSCEEICNRMITVSDTYVNDSSESSSYRDSALVAFWPSERFLHAMLKKPVIAHTDELYRVKNMREDGTFESTTETTTVDVTDATDKEVDTDIIRLDLEKEIKSAWAGDNLDIKSDQSPTRRRRNRNSRKRRSRGQSRLTNTRAKRSVSGMRPLIDEPLCGTDGKTYKNECELKKEGCYSGVRINIAHRGACPIILKSTPSTEPETSVPTTTITTSKQDLQQKDEYVKIDDIDSHVINQGMSDTNSKRKRKPKQGRGRRRRQRNRGRGNKKSDNQTNSDPDIVERTEDVTSDILENFKQFDAVHANHSANVSTTPAVATDQWQNFTNFTSTTLSTNKTAILQMREETVDDSFVLLATSNITDEGSVAFLPQNNDKNNNLAVSNIEQRAGKITSNYYKSLWKPSKEQEILKNRVQLAKKRLNKNKETNSTTQDDTEDSKLTTSQILSKSDAGKNVVVLGVLISLGQVVVIGILVGIFIYMKKRKKFKDSPDSKVKSKTKPVENSKDNPPA